MSIINPVLRNRVSSTSEGKSLNIDIGSVPLYPAITRSIELSRSRL